LKIETIARSHTRFKNKDMEPIQDSKGNLVSLYPIHPINVKKIEKNRTAPR
jgi:hypothetical protein